MIIVVLVLGALVIDWYVNIGRKQWPQLSFWYS